MMRRARITRRAPIRRGKRINQRRATPRRSSRVRDVEYMLWVKTLLCSVVEEWPDVDYIPDPCSGVIEADHVGARGIGQKSSDRETIPMCSHHHRARHAARGEFQDISRERMREWKAAAVRRTQTLWAEHNGHGGDW